MLWKIGRFALLTCTTFSYMADSAWSQSPDPYAFMQVPRGERIRFVLKEVDSMQAELQKRVSSYMVDHDCAGAALNAIDGQVGFIDRKLQAYATAPLIRQNLGEIDFISPRNIANIADDAARKGCYKEAKERYMTVIKVFYGPAFAGLRQRAQVSLENIRDK